MEKTFTELYQEYASLLTDAPAIYHEFASLNLLSLAVGRTPINVTPHVMYPNVWTILIGKSAVARKSSAIKLSLKVLTGSNNYLPNDFTPEGIKVALSEHAQGLIWRDEIGGFLQDIKRKDYMTGLSDVLAYLYDCPDSYNRKLRQDSFELKNVCFNIMSATTVSRFKDTVETGDFQSGFLSRFLIVSGERERILPRRKWERADYERLEVLQQKWLSIRKCFQFCKHRVCLHR